MTIITNPPLIGQSYWAPFEDMGIYRPRRYQWAHSDFDLLQEEAGHCNPTPAACQSQCDELNRIENGHIYRFCQLCGQHTAIINGTCTNCNTLFINP